MKKIIKKVKKHDNLIISMIITIILIIPIFYTYLAPTDWLWNFGNIYKLYLGKIIYKDVNIIDTPIFFIMGKYIFKVFGANMLTFKIYGYILCFIMYFLLYRILRKINIGKTYSMLTIVALMIIEIESIIGNGANYNILAFIIIELGILFKLKIKNEKINLIIQGILATLALLTYQKARSGIRSGNNFISNIN